MLKTHKNINLMKKKKEHLFINQITTLVFLPPFVRRTRFLRIMIVII